jgi:hypothetical protein
MATPNQFRRRGRWSLIIGTLFAALTFGAVLAYGDNVVNDVSADVNGDKIVTVTAGGAGATVNYWIVATSGADGQAGCNASDGSSATVTPSGLPGGATKTPASLAFTSCGTAAAQGITYAAGAATVPGDYPIAYSVGDSGVGTYNLNSGKFILRVLAAPPLTNDPPTDSGVPYLDGGSTSPNNTGNFTVDWAASTDPESDPIMYTLQKRDANDPGWTTVASSLGTNSYTFSGEAEGSWKYRVQAADNHSNTSNWAEDSSAIVVVDKSAPNAPTAAATSSPDYTDGSSHSWWKDTVTVQFADNGDPNLQDGSSGSGVDPSTLSGNQTFTTLGLNTASDTVKDSAGNESPAGTLDVYVDNSNPTASFSDCPSSVILGSLSTAHWTASDTGSGLATAASGSVSLDTSTIGSHTANSPAPQDHVGHTGTAAACTYSVIWDFHGFFQPVDNLPILNVAKAGSAIPIKFDLGGNQGLNIFASGYPTSNVAACDASAVDDTIEATVTAGNSSLNYDGTVNPPIGQYIYVWKTDKAWAGTCRQLRVKLADGTLHAANFKLTK